MSSGTSGAPDAEISRRIREVEQESDMDRVLAANASVLGSPDWRWAGTGPVSRRVQLASAAFTKAQPLSLLGGRAGLHAGPEVLVLGS